MTKALPQTTRGWIKLVCLVTIASGLGAYVWFGPTAIRQMRRMSVVREHLPVIRRQLVVGAIAVPVELFVATGYGGAVGVRASLDSRRDFDRLKTAVEATSPPFGVLYILTIGEDLSTLWCPSK